MPRYTSSVLFPTWLCDTDPNLALVIQLVCIHLTLYLPNPHFVNLVLWEVSVKGFTSWDKQHPMPSTCLPVAEGCQDRSVMSKLLCKSMLATHDHLLVLHNFQSPFLEDFLYHLPMDWAEVNEPEVTQSFLLSVPADMNICFPNSHDHFKIIKSPHNGLSQLHQHSWVQHIRPYEFMYDQFI